MHLSYSDVRALVSDEFELTVSLAKDVLRDSWQGGQMLSISSEYDDLVVTKKLYDEQGHNICMKKFDI